MPDPLSALEQFAQDLLQDVRARAGASDDPQFHESAFTEEVLERLTDHNETGGWECFEDQLSAKARGRQPAAKVNGWALSGDGATLDLFVALHHGEGAVVEVGLPETRKQFQLLRGFLTRALDGFHTSLEEASGPFKAAAEIHSAKDTLCTVRLFLLTDGVVRSLKLEVEPVAGLELRPVVWDLEKLSRLRTGSREVIELDFKHGYGGAVPCLEMVDPTGEYRTYLAFLPAKVLAQIYGEHGQRLLERNVRAFLQAKGKVNSGLQKTLKEEPHRFLAYNNGLCCTAAQVRAPGQGGHAMLEWVKDFQIVNGGQTTASIFHALKKDKTDISHVMVQVKLTVLSKADRVAEIVPLISRYANSQNKVNTADFSANGPFHHRMEQLSRMVWAPAKSGLERGTHWYYERARGSYSDDRASRRTPSLRADWDRENPKEQKFTKTDLAKFEHVWIGRPHLVCMGAEKNFVKLAEWMDDEGEPVVDETYFRHTVAKAILWRTTEKLFDQLDLTGYRSNTVAYAVAWLADRASRRIDLDKIWQMQRLPAAICEALKTVCGAAHAFLSSLPGNVNEASKKPECWKAFRAEEIEISADWRKELSDREFVAPKTEDEAVALEWDNLRPHFRNDSRTVEGLEAFTGKTWSPKHRREPVSALAALTWEQLRLKPGIGSKKARLLVEMLAIAAHD